MGTPTLNLDLTSVPPSLKEGIYACLVQFEGHTAYYQAAVHYGPRPVFNDTAAFEIHVLDREIADAPSVVHLEMIAYLREVRDFATKELLIEQIHADVEQARAILAV